MHYDGLQDDIGFIMENVFGESSNIYIEDSDTDSDFDSDNKTRSCESGQSSISDELENICSCMKYTYKEVLCS